jgi:hypothetical protein
VTPLAEIAVWSLAIAIAIACSVTYLRGDRSIALGLLLLAAGLSGLTAPLGDTGVRLEQPAIGVLGFLILAREPQLVLASVRRAWPPLVLLLIFLGANAASAAVFAPEVLQSLKVTLWLAISMVGGVIALLLVTGSDGKPAATFHLWIIGTALLSSAVAAAQVVAEALVGSTWGLLPYDTPLGKASGLAWEPNLLSIYLAMALSFVLVPPAARSLVPRSRWAIVVCLGTGMGLALSRGGLVALAVGLAIGLALIAARPDRRSELPRAILPGLLALAVAASGFLVLGWLGERGVGADVQVPAGDVSATLPPLVAASLEPSAGTGGEAPIGEVPDPPPTPSAEVVLDDDTVGLRIRNLMAAWRDGLRSPVLGLGPDTFGQRYIEPTCACPAHIPNQLSATFYETGVIGLVSLLAGFAVVVLAVIRAGRPDLAVALVVLGIGYQFTDAIRFATLWLLMGIAVGEFLTRGAGSDWIAGWPFDRLRRSPRHTRPT